MLAGVGRVLVRLSAMLVRGRCVLFRLFMIALSMLVRCLLMVVGGGGMVRSRMLMML